MKYDKLNLGQIEELVNVIGGMEAVQHLINGTTKIVVQTIKHVINMDADPYISNNWKVESHKRGGQFEWDPQKIQLYLSVEQQGSKCIEGNKLRKELESQPVLNANLLDYLLAHQELIPESWKGKAIFFWGTIYLCSVGYLCVRYLFWYDKSWLWRCIWLGSGFDSNNPAAVAIK